MATNKGITTLQLESSPDAKSEVVVHKSPGNHSQDMLQFTADFAALTVNGAKQPNGIPSKVPDTESNACHSSTAQDFPTVFGDVNNELQHQSFLIGQSVFNQIILLLPAMIEQHLGQNLSQESPFLNPDTVQNDIDTITKRQFTQYF